jgi:protein-disulfide isomerase
MERRSTVRRFTLLSGFLVIVAAAAGDAGALTATAAANAQAAGGGSAHAGDSAGSGDRARSGAGEVVPAAELISILAPPLATPVSGASGGDVTIVDYFDYDCPVCRAIEPTLREVVAHDPKVRLVHKDWPIFGDASVYAAYCTFAAARVGKYQQAHDALIGSKEDLDSKDAVRKVMSAAGFDLKVIDADIAHHEKEYRAVLTRNQHETSTLGMHGTPGVIVGNQIVQGGGLDYVHLSRLVAQQRQARSR